MRISRKRFLNYLKVQRSGKRNMFGYDLDIQKHYDKCYIHFVSKNKLEDYGMQVMNQTNSWSDKVQARKQKNKMFYRGYKK